MNSIANSSSDFREELFLITLRNLALREESLKKTFGYAGFWIICSI